MALLAPATLWSRSLDLAYLGPGPPFDPVRDAHRTPLSHDRAYDALDPLSDAAGVDADTRETTQKLSRPMMDHQMMHV